MAIVVHYKDRGKHMTVDRYTKAVLTVIGGALLYICVVLSAQPVSAQRAPAPFGAEHLASVKPQPVVVVGWGTVRADGEIQLTTVRDANGALRTDPHLPVKITPSEVPLEVTLGVTPQRPLPVGLTAVRPGPDWEPIRTKVEPQPGQAVPGIPR